MVHIKEKILKKKKKELTIDDSAPFRRCNKTKRMRRDQCQQIELMLLHLRRGPLCTHVTGNIKFVLKQKYSTSIKTPWTVKVKLKAKAK